MCISCEGHNVSMAVSSDSKKCPKGKSWFLPSSCEDHYTQVPSAIKSFVVHVIPRGPLSYTSPCVIICKQFCFGVTPFKVANRQLFEPQVPYLS